MAFFKKSVFGVISLVALGLVACGDDSGSNNFSFAPTHGDQVGSIYELGQCSAEKEGVSILVTGENTYYLCTSAEWKPVAEYNGPVSSSTLTTSSSSALTTSSSSAPTEDLGSSSSVKDPEQVDGSSSSVTPSGGSAGVEGSCSSSEIPGQAGNDNESSSSVLTLSSSSAPTEDPSSSSSSVIASSSGTKHSSSSVMVSSSSSTPIEDLSSSSSIKVPETAEGSSSSKANWAYLNPAKTYGTMTDIRDGQVYKTVTIGTQTWMAENLNYAPENFFSMSRYAYSACYNSHYYIPGSDDYCDLYGRLYTWEVAMNNGDCAYDKECKPNGTIQGICPSGWHLPSKEEWLQLVEPMTISVRDDKFYNGSAVDLKTVAGWREYAGSRVTVGTNASGFSALPAGFWNGKNFEGAGDDTYFWSASEHGYSFAGALFLSTIIRDDATYFSWELKDKGYSVRCLKD